MAEKDDDLHERLKELLDVFPVDASALQDAFKSTATLNEKLAAVALEAADKATDVSNQFSRETLAKLAELSRSYGDPKDYANALSDFASANAELTARIMAAYAEIAKKVQVETVELLMEAGKERSEDASAAVKKATDRTSSTVKRAAAGGTMKVGKGRRPTTPPPRE